MYAWAWPTFRVWADTWQQWRWLPVGMGAPVRAGLDWQQVVAALDLSGVTREDWPEIFNGLKTMQEAALARLVELDRT